MKTGGSKGLTSYSRLKRSMTLESVQVSNCLSLSSLLAGEITV